ncbi:MAG: hypothetical protein QOD88_2346 [Mycobacterium sp.]|nr:hypothetical protein [Mycobacterium sp.]
MRPVCWQTHTTLKRLAQDDFEPITLGESACRDTKYVAAEAIQAIGVTTRSAASARQSPARH